MLKNDSLHLVPDDDLREGTEENHLLHPFPLSKTSEEHRNKRKFFLLVGLGAILLTVGVGLLLIAIIGATAYKRRQNTALLMDCDFDLEGHRGARGLYPENTIVAYKSGIDNGVTTIEMDTCISKDMQVIMSHDPFLNPDFCLNPSGELIANESIAMSQYRLFDMDYDTIAKCDCGIRGNPHFPEQKKMSAFKPTLSQVFTEIEAYIKQNKLKRVMYNIETKTRPDRDNVFTPPPDVFVNLLHGVIEQHKMQKRVIIESFDVRTLKLMREKDPSIPLSLLVDKSKNFHFQDKLDELGFLPEYYSPHYSLMTTEIAEYMKLNKVKVVPWTPNTVEEINHLLSMGVDGIITDYPNFSAQLAGCKKRKVAI